ncbi:hypothetical protein CASFOL_004851 [Castilleja foliolosa]|uniref:Uncharacterized protein n=1 Tax=Castilleja foliolosa TaxID=1961234 RepID=A0ABD3EFB8_9LAMI
MGQRRSRSPLSFLLLRSQSPVSATKFHVTLQFPDLPPPKPFTNCLLQSPSEINRPLFGAAVNRSICHRCHHARPSLRPKDEGEERNGTGATMIIGSCKLRGLCIPPVVLVTPLDGTLSIILNRGFLVEKFGIDPNNACLLGLGRRTLKCH